MVLPVAQALASSGLAMPRVLALTTAAGPVRASGLELLQFKDFVRDTDGPALEIGRQLMMEMPGPVLDREETAAYLGLSYLELERDVGAVEARRRYQRDKRQAFLPIRLLQRILGQLKPALVVATNSPRAERAAIHAARAMGIPSICLIDLFCLDEVKWIGKPDYADHLCVLNESVRQFLITAGRSADQLSVTGNPAFDALADPRLIAEGRRLREENRWGNKKVVLWPTQVEPAYHPFNGKPGDMTLPQRALERVAAWVLSRNDCILCVRPRAGETNPVLPIDERIVLVGQDINLASILHATDVVVTLNSTVALEGHMAGARVLQILGSVFDEAMPLKQYAIADDAVGLDHIEPALQSCVGQDRRSGSNGQYSATQKVLRVISQFL